MHDYNIVLPLLHIVVLKPMVMTPNFHQLVAYPRDEQTLMKQKNLADLREKTIKELSVA